MKGTDGAAGLRRSDQALTSPHFTRTGTFKTYRHTERITGYYKNYCYLPLYIFCGEHLLCARLRSADRDAADGVVEELEGIVARIRAQWPRGRILVRGAGVGNRGRFVKGG